MTYVGVPAANKLGLRVLWNVLFFCALLVLLWLTELSRNWAKELVWNIGQLWALGIMVALGLFLSSGDLITAFRVWRWKVEAQRLEVECSHLLAEMKNARFGYAPYAIRVVAAREQEVAELVCGFVRTEVAFLRVMVPNGVQIDDATWSRWDEFDRQDLLAEAELKRQQPLPGRYVRKPTVPIAVRAETLLAAIEAVAPMVREFFSEHGGSE